MAQGEPTVVLGEKQLMAAHVQARHTGGGRIREGSPTVFGGKQNNSFWQTVFETGRSPQGVQVLAKPLNLVEMIKSDVKD